MPTSMNVKLFINTQVLLACAFNILVFFGNVGFVRERGVVSQEIIKKFKKMNILLNRCVE